MEYKSTTPTRIFVVEDDPIQLRLIKYAMELNPDHEVYTFETGKDCLDNLHLNPQILSLDYGLPDMSGEEILKRVLRYNKHARVIMLSGQKDVDTAVDLLRQGAQDYIAKGPEMKKRLINSVQLLKKNMALEEEVETLKEELTERYQPDNLLGGSNPAMQKVYKLLEKATSSDITVSITGETGTGKEVVAKSIHYGSKRQKGRFIAINAGAIPAELLESEFFGYEKGAFTGAAARKIGKFELANKGTLFLDEIGEMNLHLQAKLLRALQEREIIRVGGSTPIPFDARIIIATHRNLAELVQQGKFREDLYYRLLGLPIPLPPLRDRGGDVLLLAKHFLTEFSKKNKSPVLKLAQSAKDKLLNYKFPGNVRELKMTIELAAVLATGKRITKDDIQFRSPRKSEELLEGEMTMREYNKKIVYHFLKKYDRNIVLVSKKLDIGKSTIYKILKEDNDEKKMVL